MIQQSNFEFFKDFCVNHAEFPQKDINKLKQDFDFVQSATIDERLKFFDKKRDILLN
jgi:hypothetical protein